MRRLCLNFKIFFSSLKAFRTVELNKTTELSFYIQIWTASMKFKIVTEEEFNLVGKWSIDAYYQAFTHKEATNGVVKEMLNKMKQSGIFGDPAAAEENSNVSTNRYH